MHHPKASHGELLQLALLTAVQELDVPVTMAPSWNALGPRLREFYERAATIFMASLAAQEDEHGRTGERGVHPGRGGGRPG
jgi:hypothetical protein